MPSSHHTTLSTAALFLLLAGCAEEPLSTEVRPLGPISSDQPAAPAKRKEPSAPAGTLVRRAERSLEAKNPAGAERDLEEALLAEPNNRKALRLLAQVTQRLAQGMERPLNSPRYLRSAEALRTLRKNYPDLTTEEREMVPLVFYNEACTLALNGEADRAVKALNEAVEAGFVNIERIDNDEELDPVRKNPAFVTLQKRLEDTNIDRLMSEYASKSFAFDFKLPDPNGKVLSLGDLKGKVVLVDFWGTWCPPCRKELPHLAALSQAYHDKGLEIVGINYESETGDEARKLIQTFAREHAIPYPCVVGDPATKNQVPNFEGFPTTLFLDRSGKVRLKLTGYHSYIPLETAVEKLLADDIPPQAKK